LCWLQREIETMVLRSSPRDQGPLDVIVMEEPVHIGAGRLTDEAAARDTLLIGQDSTGMNHNCNLRTREAGRQDRPAWPF